MSQVHSSFVEHFSNYAKDIVKTYQPSLQNYILDIGSNDGTLLKFLKKWDIKQSRLTSNKYLKAQKMVLIL